MIKQLYKKTLWVFETYKVYQHCSHLKLLKCFLLFIIQHGDDSIYAFIFPLVVRRNDS